MGLLSQEKINALVLHRNYKNLAAQWRGKVLNYAVELELIIQDFLAYYFCGKSKKKRQNFLTLFIESETTFNTKIKVVNKIFRNYSDQTEYKFERVKSYLENIRKIRNIVAHSDISSTNFINNLNNKTGVFKQVYKESKSLSISEKVFDNFIAEAACLDFFIEQINILGKPPPNKV